jgi:hypothetical protein
MDQDDLQMTDVAKICTGLLNPCREGLLSFTDPDTWIVVLRHKNYQSVFVAREVNVN